MKSWFGGNSLRYDLLERLLNGYLSSVMVCPDGTQITDEIIGGGVLPGSFNPLHKGHEDLAMAASSMLGTDVIFELSISNVDKSPLSLEEIRKRIDQFSGKATIVVTRAITFEDMAALFPGCSFVIGWDTAFRLFQPRYYNENSALMLEALSFIRNKSCNFLVAGRLKEGVYQTLETLPVPVQFRDMLSEVPEAKFRVDISSTELR